MDRAELEGRTLRLAVDVIEAVKRLRAGVTCDVIGKQVIKSATSVGANYREANRAESRKDFQHKLAITAKEASETHYWLEVMLQARLLPPDIISPLLNEADQLVRILNAARHTMRKNG